MAGTYENADGRRPAGTVRRTKCVPAGSPKAPGRRSTSRHAAIAREEGARPQSEWRGGASSGSLRICRHRIEELRAKNVPRNSSNALDFHDPFERNSISLPTQDRRFVQRRMKKCAEGLKRHPVVFASKIRDRRFAFHSAESCISCNLFQVAELQDELTIQASGGDKVAS